MLNIDGINRIAENRIREAHDEGKFENLPGMGQPLNLADNALVPPSQRAASYILKNAGVLPEWAQLQRDIEIEQQAVYAMPAKVANASLAFSGKRMRTSLTLEEQYCAWRSNERARFTDRIKACNHMVLKLCLVGPQNFITVRPLNTRALLDQFDELVSPTLPVVRSTAAHKHVPRSSKTTVESIAAAVRRWFVTVLTVYR